MEANNAAVKRELHDVAEALKELKTRMTNLPSSRHAPSPPPAPTLAPPSSAMDIDELTVHLQPYLQIMARADLEVALGHIKVGFERALADQNARTYEEVWNQLQPILNLVGVIGKHMGFTVHADLQLGVDGTLPNGPPAL